jgi:hypothetical protein
MAVQVTCGAAAAAAAALEGGREEGRSCDP